MLRIAYNPLVEGSNSRPGTMMHMCCYLELLVPRDGFVWPARGELEGMFKLCKLKPHDEGEAEDAFSGWKAICNHHRPIGKAYCSRTISLNHTPTAQARAQTFAPLGSIIHMSA